MNNSSYQAWRDEKALGLQSASSRTTISTSASFNTVHTGDSGMSGTPKYKVAFNSFGVEVVCHARENPSKCLILLRMIANLAISFRVASGLQIECYQKTNVLPVHNIQYEVRVRHR